MFKLHLLVVIVCVLMNGVSSSSSDIIVARDKSPVSANAVCSKCEEKIDQQAKENSEQQKEINQQMKEIYYQQKKIHSLESEISSFQTRLNNVEKQGQLPKTAGGGVTNVRYGRTVCPDSATMVYRGDHNFQVFNRLTVLLQSIYASS